MTHAVTRLILVLLLTAGAPIKVVWAEDDAIWHELFHAMRFSEVNRAQLERDCNENPLYSSNPRLKGLCAKRHLIPDGVIEEAALPYLKLHVTVLVAKEAIAKLTVEPATTLSRKLIAAIASGRNDQFTPEELVQLQRQNETRYGLALRAFATDREQGLAVARAMLDYEP